MCEALSAVPKQTMPELEKIVALAKQHDDLALDPRKPLEFQDRKITEDLTEEAQRQCAKIALSFSVSSFNPHNNCFDKKGNPLPLKDLTIVMNKVSEIKKYYSDRQKKREELAHEVKKIFENLFKGQSMKIHEELESCFADVEGHSDKQKSAPYLPTGAKYPKVFTDQDIKDAKACESSLLFH